VRDFFLFFSQSPKFWTGHAVFAGKVSEVSKSFTRSAKTIGLRLYGLVIILVITLVNFDTERENYWRL